MKTGPFKSTFVLLYVCICFLFNSCNKNPGFYTISDFPNVNKIDAHFHYNISDPTFLMFADSLNFKIITPNTRSIENGQFDVARDLRKQYPNNLAFFGTFAVNNWDQPGYADSTINRVRLVMDNGAAGIKIWKNIGMEIRDANGKCVMVDNPVFDPVFNYIENNNILVLGHLGEPKNCWLPIEEMTVESDRGYFSRNPQYHMYLHPEDPSYEDQLKARDNRLEKNPNMKFIGAHLGSLEWSVDELGKWLDKFPNHQVDMSARINHLQYQSITEWDKVRNFMIKYQDRLLYATDRSVSANNTDLESLKNSMMDRWVNGWLFFATDSIFNSFQVDDKEIKGLHLPKDVVDKIYYDNAEYILSL